jgi:hypothetical protein
VHGRVHVVGEQVGLGDRDHQPRGSLAPHRHAGDPVGGDGPVLELGGQLLLARGQRGSGGATRTSRGGVAVGHHVQHPIDRLVVEDLVEGAEPGRRVLPGHHPEAVAAQPGVAARTSLHGRRPDVLAAGGLGARAPGQPVGEPGLADAGHPGHRDRRVAVAQESGRPLGGLGQCGERTPGDGGADGRPAVSQR